MTEASHDQLASVVREHAGQLATALMRVTGDFATAEDLVQDAVLAALQHWPVDGIPERPDAWLFTVAKRRALDGFRRADNYRAKLAQLQWPVQPAEDERLRLIFTCCHPALSRPAQIALTLRVVCGLTTGQIARAFLVHETAIARRITRAKRKITDAGIPYRIPDDDELAARLTEALTVIYLLFNEGYLATTGLPQSRDLAEEAEWLAVLLHRLMPAEPEVAGLLALVRLHRARAAARFGSSGGLVLLQDQDRSLWDREVIADAVRLLTRAARRQRPGPYQLQAAIVACHAEAERWEDTDWEQIVLLYDMLLHLAPSPVTRLHRAIAVRYTTGPRAAMAELDDLAGLLDDYHLYHASRAELLRELGHPDQARAADCRALELTANPAERAVLQQRVQAGVPPVSEAADRNVVVGRQVADEISRQLPHRAVRSDSLRTATAALQAGLGRGVRRGRVLLDEGTQRLGGGRHLDQVVEGALRGTIPSFGGKPMEVGADGQ